MTPDQQWFCSFIIAGFIVFAPIILVISGAILRKINKKISKWLLIAGGLWLGLLALGFVLLSFAQMFLL